MACSRLGLKKNLFLTVLRKQSGRRIMSSDTSPNRNVDIPDSFTTTCIVMIMLSCSGKVFSQYFSWKKTLCAFDLLNEVVPHIRKCSLVIHNHFKAPSFQHILLFIYFDALKMCLTCHTFERKLMKITLQLIKNQINPLFYFYIWK